MPYSKLLFILLILIVKVAANVAPSVVLLKPNLTSIDTRCQVPIRIILDSFYKTL
jgi:hypothetical protein